MQPDNKSLLYRSAHLLLIGIAGIYLAYIGLLTFFILTMAGPHLEPYLKPVTRLVLTAIVLITALRTETLLTILAATLGALLALGWYSRLPPTYHNATHFHAEVLPQLTICALAVIAFAARRATSTLVGDPHE